MGSVVAAAASLLGSPAGDQVIAIGQAGIIDMERPQGYTPEELGRRRVASRRLAWVLGLTALAIYLLGFIYYRP
jgi:hypothetical protein